MPKDDFIRIQHMREAALSAVQSAQGRLRSDLDTDLVWMMGLVKCVEIIGEAAAHVSDATRSQYPRIPWPQIIGMRNRLVHVYFDIDRDRVWDTITIDLPILIEELNNVLEKKPIT